MMRSLSACLLAALATLPAAAGTVSSTFDTDAEGWSFFNDARDFAWTDEFTADGGAIRATDRRSGPTWYFAASDAYHGNLSAFANGSVSWDIYGITGAQNVLGASGDLIITGNGIALGLDTGTMPVNGEWTTWTASLSLDADWRVVNSLSNGSLGVAATQAQLDMVLANVDGFYIQGEYTSGADSTAIDNVTLTVPAPGAMACAMLGLGAFARRRRCG